MKYSLYILFVAFAVIFVGCEQNTDEIITEKIQYDVNIKSPDPEYDWWIQNLVGPQRDKLVSILVDGAKTGKWQAYDYFSNPIDKYEVQAIFADTMIVTIMKKEPPYELFDTTIVYNILNEDIIRLRFLEEWKMNPENLNFEKRILGLAPVARRLDFNGIERWQPLFWIYVDEDFKSDLTNNRQ
jgi:gliding motility-associated GldN-like protein